MTQEAVAPDGAATIFENTGSTDNRAGEQLGDFRLLNLLGEGVTGVVYRARQAGMERDVALKILKKDFALDPEYVKRFEVEASMAAKLDHPNIVRGIAAGKSNGKHYLAMELIDGENANQRLDRCKVFPVHDAVKVGIGVASALDHVQSKGLVHRDVKPANIMITSKGTVKLTDLGLVKRVVDDPGLTQVGATFGTPWYMAPEQAADARRADTRSDIYALGGTLYHLLAGKPPFEGRTSDDVLKAKKKGPPAPVRQHNREVPSSLERIIDKMLERDPGQRFQTPAEVVAALKKVPLSVPHDDIRVDENDDPGETQPPAPDRTEEPVTWADRLRAAWDEDRHLGSTAVLALVIALTVYGIWQMGDFGGGGAVTPEVTPVPTISTPIPPEKVQEILEQAFKSVRLGNVAEARAVLAGQSAEHPEVAEFDRPLHELDHGVLVLFEYLPYQALEPTNLLPTWSSQRMTLTPNDKYRFAITLARDCYVYAFQEDTHERSVVIFFPNPKHSNQANPLHKGVRHWLPNIGPPGQGTQNEPRLHLNKSVGEERVYFLALTRPLQDVDAIKRRLLIDSEDTLRADLQDNLDSFLQPGEPPGASCFADGVLQSMSFDHIEG